MMDKKLLVGVVALVVLVLGFAAYSIFGGSATDTGTEATLAASRPFGQAGPEGYGRPEVAPGPEQETFGAPVPPLPPQAGVEAPQTSRGPAGPLPGGTPADSTRATSSRGSFGESFRATFGLMRTFQGLGTLEEEGKAPLTAAQAKSILALFEPLRSQESLTPAGATSTLEKLEALLTPAQQEALEETRQRRPGGGGRTSAAGGPGEPGPTGVRPQGPAGSAGPFGGAGGRQRPAGGGESRPPGAGMENMNPFNLDSDNPMAQRMSERIEAVFDALKAKAGQ